MSPSGSDRRFPVPDDMTHRVRDLERRMQHTERIQKFDSDDKPAAPVNVGLIFRIWEDEAKPRFKGISSCDPSTPNTCQAEIKFYHFQIRAVTSGGNDIHGTRETKTVKRDANDTDFDPHVVWPHIQRPRAWYYQTRASITDRAGRTSPWSAWSNAILPWTHSNPTPPPPANLTLTFDTFEKHRHEKFRAIVQGDEKATNWDLPGTDFVDQSTTGTTTVTVGVGSATLVGTGTLYTTELERGMDIKIGNEVRSIDGITDNTHAHVDRGFNTANLPYTNQPLYIEKDTADINHYVVELQYSTDGSSWTTDSRQKIRKAKILDADSTWKTIFMGIRPRRYYRARALSVDKYGRRGAWSSFTGIGIPTDNNNPPAPASVHIFDAGVDRVVLDWAPPTAFLPTRGTVTANSGGSSVVGTGTRFTSELDQGDIIKLDSETRMVVSVTDDTHLNCDTNWGVTHTSVTLFTEEHDPDVQFYQYQISQSATFATIYKKDMYFTATKKAIKVEDADRGGTFYGRVRSVDAALNRSRWIPGKINSPYGNSPSDSADGVVIGAGGGKTKVVWSVLGRVRQLPESATHDYDMDEGLRTTKVRARVKQAPIGQSIVVSIYKNQSSIGTVTIAAGAKRGVNDSLTTNWNDSDVLSYSVDQVGTTFPGKNLVVVHVLT